LSNPRALEVLLFGRAGFIGSYVFRTPKVTIGRAPDAMLRLDDSSVSLNHATLSLEGGLFRIKDNGSRTGTRVNGAAILPRQPVEPTDELSIGPFRLRVTLCDPDLDDEPTHVNDEASHRLSSLVADISKPTEAEPFFPPLARGPNGAKSRSDAPPRVARGDRHPEPPPRSEFALEDSGSSPTLVGRSERPPPIEPASTRSREARAPAAAPAARAEFFEDLFGPPKAATVKPAPSRKSERPRPPPPEEAEVAPAVSERPVAKGLPAHLDTHEVGPAAFAFAVHDAEPRPRQREEDDEDDDEDESNFVPAFDLVNELLAAGLDGETAAGRSLLLEVVHSRDDRVRSIHHPRVRGHLRVPGLKEILGTIEPDGSVSLLPDACPGLTMKERNRSVSPASLTNSTSNKITFVAGMQARCELPSGDLVLLHWVSKANAVRVPPIQLRPSREGMRSGSASFAFHIAVALFIGLIALGDDHPVSDINAGRFATINTKELELEPPPPPPPPQKDEPVVDNAPMIEMPTNPHDVSKKNAKVAVKGAAVQHSSSEAPPSNTPSASTQKILSSLGGATSSASAISVTNLDALPSGVGGDFKVSGALGKAPSDSLRVASGTGGGKDVDTKTVSELGANKMGRVQGATGSGTVRARVTAAPQSIRGEGHLDRGEIQKVVNAHLYQVQGCYERQLAKDPSLSGKVSYDWDVGLTGGVSNVRVGRSSIHSVEVTTCIQSAIQGWHFPTPQGGTVTVTYPFAFSALGG
jgi:hypothetical protein